MHGATLRERYHPYPLLTTRICWLTTRSSITGGTCSSRVTADSCSRRRRIVSLHTGDVHGEGVHGLTPAAYWGLRVAAAPTQPVDQYPMPLTHAPKGFMNQRLICSNEICLPLFAAAPLHSSRASVVLPAAGSPSSTTSKVCARSSAGPIQANATCCCCCCRCCCCCLCRSNLLGVFVS
jgi:hypothetical protein